MERKEKNGGKAEYRESGEEGEAEVRVERRRLLGWGKSGRGQREERVERARGRQGKMRMMPGERLAGSWSCGSFDRIEGSRLKERKAATAGLRR